MSEKEKTVWERLAEPFTDEDIDWRVMECGESNGRVWAKLAAYVDSRAIMNRLDDVLGPSRWSDEYKNIQTPDGPAIICRINIYSEDGRVVFKEDGADFNRGIETAKSGISDAFKRAANKFGMGRHLYSIGETWGQNIKEGYVPRGTKGVSIYSEKKLGKGKRYWCPTPKLDGNSSAPPAEPPKAEPKPKAAPDREKTIKWIIAREKKVYPNFSVIQRAREKHLGDTNLEDKTLEELVKYGTYLKNEKKEAA